MCVWWCSCDCLGIGSGAGGCINSLKVIKETEMQVWVCVSVCLCVQNSGCVTMKQGPIVTKGQEAHTHVSVNYEGTLTEPEQP